MKKILFISLLTFPLTVGFIECYSQLCNISGTIDKGYDRAEVFLIRKSNRSIVSSAFVKDGQFVLSETINGGTDFYYLSIDSAHKKNSKPFLLEQGNIVLTVDSTLWPVVDLSGSESNNQYLRCRKVWDSLPNDSVRIKEMLNFIQQNKDSYYTPHLLLGMKEAISFQNFKEEYAALSLRSKESRYGVKAREYILKKERIISTFKLGNGIPNIKLKNLKNENIELLSLISKHNIVLIDFWASWCGPCREQIPKMDSFYRKYKKSGFEIISISVGDSRIAWENAVRKLNMQWTQCIDENKEVDAKYSIVGIPALILVDKRGKIIAYDCPRSIVSTFGPSLRPDDLQETIRAELSRMK